MTEAAVAVGGCKFFNFCKVGFLGLDDKHLSDALAFLNLEYARLIADDYRADTPSIRTIYDSVQNISIEAVFRFSKCAGKAF